MRSRLQPDQPRAGRHRSLALRTWFERLAPGLSPAVLDLGPASGVNLNFFHGMGARLHVADLYRSLTESGERSPDDLGAFDRACARMLPDPAESSFDLILTWDLLNYLSQQEIGILARYLRGYCRSHTFLYALISIRHQLPLHPLTFQIVDMGVLDYGSPSPVLRPCPEYKESRLLQLLAGFEVERCFLLRHGYKEYLLGFQDAAAHAVAGPWRGSGRS